MTIKSVWLRRIHKWVGLVIGLQFLLWAISGTAMALLDMDEVAGGPRAQTAVPALSAASTAWPQVQRALRGERLSKLAIRRLPQGSAYQVTTSKGVRLFSAIDGSPVAIDARIAAAVARAAHPDSAAVKSVRPLQELTLAVREHELPIWEVDFGDAQSTAYYVSGSTGELLERRNDSWRLWDFFWMLHIMDYGDRASFNHPLIIAMAVGLVWLAGTGVWLLFRTMWRHDFAWLRAQLGRFGVHSK